MNEEEKESNTKKEKDEVQFGKYKFSLNSANIKVDSVSEVVLKVDFEKVKFIVFSII